MPGHFTAALCAKEGTKQYQVGDHNTLALVYIFKKEKKYIFLMIKKDFIILNKIYMNIETHFSVSY